MEKIKSNLFRLCTIIAIILGCYVFGNGVMRHIENSKLYDNTAQVIMARYEETTFPTSSITTTEETQKSISYLLLSGVDDFYEVTDTQAQEVKITMKQRLGQVKLIAQNTKTQELTTFALEENTNTLLLPAGTHALYVVGKRFNGRVHIDLS